MFTNSITECYSWEEAISVIVRLKLPPLCITGYCANQMQVVAKLDLEHIWDVKSAKALAHDFMLQTVGIAQIWSIDH